MARLTPQALVYDLRSAGDPQLSPDASRVLYAIGAADKDADHGTSQVWLADRDGSHAQRLTWTGDRNREARWSPDGRRLTSGNNDLLYPAWSPDGRRLAAREPFNSFFARLALIDATTGTIERIGWDRGVIAVWSWSPTGDRIVFAGDEEPSGGAELFVYDVTSKSIRQVSTDLECLPDAGFPTIVPPSQPVWLDDDQVLLNAVRAGEGAVYR